MKKLIFLAATLTLVGCSNNNEDELIENSSELVEVNLGASTTPSGDTRAYMGTIQNSKIGIMFESTDAMDVFDHYEKEERHQFTSTLDSDDQSGKFKGKWQNAEESYAVIFPAVGIGDYQTSVDLGSGNTYHFNILDEQISPKIVEGSMVSCDRKANVLLGAQNTKTINGRSIFLAPVCTYLYFASYNEWVDITTTGNNFIAGETTATTNTNIWIDDDGFKNALTSLSCTGTKTIHAKGTHVNRTVSGYDNRVYEFVVCLIPGSFGIGKLSVGGRLNTKELLLERGHMYNLGTIDTPSTPVD